MTLGQIVVYVGVNTSGLQSGLNQAINQAAQQGQQAGQAFGSGFGRGAGSSLGGVLNQLRYFRSQASELLNIGGEVTGLRIAGEYQRLEVSLRTLVGSAKEARRILQEAKEVGVQTPFETEDVVAGVRSLLAVGVASRQATRDVRALADATAAIGGDTTKFNEIVRLTQGLRARTNITAQTIGALAARGIDVDRVIGAATGRQLATGQGVTALRGMGQEERYNTFIRGLEKVYGGAASGQAGQTLLGTAENLGEAVRMIMEPTGQLLIPVVTRFNQLVINGASALNRLNEATGGGAGLIALAIGGALVVRRLAAGGFAAFGAIGRLTVAINALAAASNSAAVGVGRNAAATQLSGMGGAFGSYGRVGGALDSAAQIGATAVDPIDPEAKEKLHGYIRRLFGDRIGSWFGKSGSDTGSDAGERTAKATESAAATLKELKFSGIGGGGRFSQALRGAELEAQYAVLRSMNAKIG